MQETDLYTKIGIAIGGFVVFGLVGGRLFFALAKHFIIKYFDDQDKKVDAAFKRIDELRKTFEAFKLTDFRDYKRDVAIKILELTASVNELYNRTNNYIEVKKTVEFCDDKNKTGSD